MNKLKKLARDTKLAPDLTLDENHIPSVEEFEAEMKEFMRQCLLKNLGKTK